MSKQSEIIKRTEEWLDERWVIYNMDDARPQDVSFYAGAIRACQFLGYSWIRDENGKHKLIKE